MAPSGYTGVVAGMAEARVYFDGKLAGALVRIGELRKNRSQA